MAIRRGRGPPVLVVWRRGLSGGVTRARVCAAGSANGIPRMRSFRSRPSRGNPVPPIDRRLRRARAIATGNGVVNFLWILNRSASQPSP